MRYAPDKAQHSCAGLSGLSACTSFLGPGAPHMTAVFDLRRSQASLAVLPVDVWSSMSTQAGLTLNDKCAVRSSSASLRRLVNAATTKVRPALSLADLPVLRPGQHRLLFSTHFLCLSPTYTSCLCRSSWTWQTSYRALSRQASGPMCSAYCAGNFVRAAEGPR